MGGLDYYSFLIEPERLLKLGYVLHRSKSIKILPTYQRLIKKNRLSQIKKFLSSGGYFPNSLVVSVDNGGKRPRFEQAAPVIEGSQTKHGVLHLPNKYRSMYIIDGQHRLYGSGAPTRLRRIFQRAVQSYRDDFSPEGLNEYWRDQSKQYNIDTYRRVADIELKLREDIKEALSQQYGSMWLKKGLPEKLYTDLSTEAAKKNRTIENPAEEKTPWDCLNLIHLRMIMSHGSHWSNLFQKKFTIPREEGRKKDDKTAWLARLNAIRNKADHEYSVTKEEADYVAALHDWLLLGSPDAIERYSAGAESAPVDAVES